MFQRIIVTALGAGIGVGILLAALQHVALVPLILEAEKYERHAGGATDAWVSSVQHWSWAAPAEAHEQPGSEQSANDEAGSNPPMRAVLTTLATILTAVGFAFILAGGFAVAGREVGPFEGFLWGLAGCAVFTLAPAFGLPPELPGSVSADLLGRQIWWVGTAAATALGLGLLAFGRGRWVVPVACAALVAPHLVGPPAPPAGAGTVPPELAAAFAARVLTIGAVFWAVLGWASGRLYAHLGRSASGVQARSTA